ncbi:MAG: glutamate--tRNA ligase [Candidatus Saccharibacteria bacterium]
MSDIRTRFAPSPTGFLHVGGVRTALYAWLIAKQNEGEFILRIEDTDKVREVEGSEKHIIDSLHFLGIEWNEGPDIGGQYEPYRQSERLEIYKEWAHKLVKAGRAYPDPYTPEQLNDLREMAKVSKKPFLFREHRPETMPMWDGESTLRFKSNPKPYKWHDEVMGELSTGPEVIDDFIIMKNDGYPTYNFSHIIDDELMKITHIVRSQEFISSTPKYLNLYEALNFTPPKLVTLPFVLGPDGKKKLSKRDGAKDILDYQKDGYLPEVLLNFLGTLGWNDGTTKEIYSKEELISLFSIERINKAGAKFDEQRLTWLNGHYIREMKLDELYLKTKSFWPESAKNFDDEYKKKVLALVKDRLKFFSEIPKLTDFFFEDLTVDKGLIENNKFLSKLSNDEIIILINLSREKLSSSDFSEQDLTAKLNQLLEETNKKPGELFSLIRIITTWAPSSPGLSESLSVIGKEKTLSRIDGALANL